MGLIIREIGILGDKNKYKKLRALFDTGAGRNYICREFSDEETIDDVGIVEYLGKDSVIFPDGFEKMGSIIKLKLLKIENIPIEEPEFFVLDMKLYDVIIGANLMQTMGMILNPYLKKISFN